MTSKNSIGKDTKARAALKNWYRARKNVIKNAISHFVVNICSAQVNMRVHFFKIN